MAVLIVVCAMADFGDNGRLWLWYNHITHEYFDILVHLWTNYSQLLWYCHLLHVFLLFSAYTTNKVLWVRADVKFFLLKVKQYIKVLYQGGGIKFYCLNLYMVVRHITLRACKNEIGIESFITLLSIKDRNYFKLLMHIRNLNIHVR